MSRLLLLHCDSKTMHVGLPLLLCSLLLQFSCCEFLLLFLVAPILLLVLSIASVSACRCTPFICCCRCGCNAGPVKVTTETETHEHSFNLYIYNLYNIYIYACTPYIYIYTYIHIYIYIYIYIISNWSHLGIVLSQSWVVGPQELQGLWYLECLSSKFEEQNFSKSAESHRTFSRMMWRLIWCTLLGLPGARMSWSLLTLWALWP